MYLLFICAIQWYHTLSCWSYQAGRSLLNTIVHKYIEYHSECPLVGIRTPPPPLPQASVPPPELRRLEKKLSTLPTLCSISSGMHIFSYRIQKYYVARYIHGPVGSIVAKNTVHCKSIMIIFMYAEMFGIQDRHANIQCTAVRTIMHHHHRQLG